MAPPPPSRTAGRAPARGAPASRARALESLRVLVGALSRSARTVEQRTGVTNAQLFLLQQLRDAGALSVNDLAERARTQHSTASIVVGRLVRAGLAAKVQSDTDARRAVVSVTRKGLRVLTRAPAPPTTHLFKALERLSAAEALRLADGLRVLIRALRLAPPKGAPGMLFEESTNRQRRPRKP